jgi:hypothetical protein
LAAVLATVRGLGGRLTVTSWVAGKLVVGGTLSLVPAGKVGKRVASSVSPFGNCSVLGWPSVLAGRSTVKVVG